MTQGEFRVIKSENQKRDEEVVDLLARKLQEAKDGMFDTVYIVTMRGDGVVGTSFTRGCDVARRIGALELLKHDVMAVGGS